LTEVYFEVDCNGSDFWE